MMKEKKLTRAIIYQEYFDLLGNPKDAIVLAQMVYRQQRIKDFDLYQEIINKKNELHGYNLVELQNGWIYKSCKELSDEIMIAGEKTVSRSIIRMVELGYLISRKNPLYKWDQTTQYIVNIKKLRDDLLLLGYQVPNYEYSIPITPSDTAKELISQNDQGKSQNDDSKSLDDRAIPETTTKTNTYTTDNTEYILLNNNIISKDINDIEKEEVIISNPKLQLSEKKNEIYQEVNSVIEFMKSKFIEYGITYCGGTKERSFAKHCLSKTMQSNCEMNGFKDFRELADHVFDAYSKTKFVTGICSIQDFYQKWGKVIESYKKESMDKNPKQSSAFSEHVPISIPTLEECTSFFKENGYLEETGKKFYHHYSAKLWKNNNGTSIGDWQHLAQGSWFKEECIDLYTENVKIAIEERSKMKGLSDRDWNCYLEEVLYPKYGVEKRREMNIAFKKRRDSDQNVKGLFRE